MAVGARDEREVWSVSQLNLEVRAVLEGTFGTLWVEGEISNLARPRSGHIYFSLKDDAAQVRCAMFRMNNRRLDFEPDNGMQVVVQGRVSLYPERGDFQIIAQAMQRAGDGALRRAFELLKKRLAAEGLFDAERKRPLPTLPRRIGIITSPTGAAIRDILSVLERRFAAIEVDVFPVAVQGEAAPAQIAAAIARASARAECDVLVVGRGGGSMEDLWAFNEEVVARAIAAAGVPVVSAVGHETDFTIADFVADQRAATPSAAAEMVSPDGDAWRSRRNQALRRLEALINARLKGERQALQWLLRRLPHPRTRIDTARARRAELLARMGRAMAARMLVQRQRTLTARAHLSRHSPAARVHAGRAHASTLDARLQRGVSHALRTRRDHLLGLLRTLESIGPQATLQRGYAVITRDEDGALLRSSLAARPGEQLTARLADGRLGVTVNGPIAEE